MTGPYRPKQKWGWFWQRPGYIRFMLREFTALFIGAYLVLLLWMLYKLGVGEAAFTHWLAILNRPHWMILHALALLAGLWHTVTWFNATPQAFPVFIGEKRLPKAVVAIALGYAPWIVVTALILWGALA